MRRELCYHSHHRLRALSETFLLCLAHRMTQPHPSHSRHSDKEPAPLGGALPHTSKDGAHPNYWDLESLQTASEEENAAAQPSPASPPAPEHDDSSTHDSAPPAPGKQPPPPAPDGAPAPKPKAAAAPPRSRGTYQHTANAALSGRYAADRHARPAPRPAETEPHPAKRAAPTAPCAPAASWLTPWRFRLGHLNLIGNWVIYLSLVLVLGGAITALFSATPQRTLEENSRTLYQEMQQMAQGAILVQNSFGGGLWRIEREGRTAIIASAVPNKACVYTSWRLMRSGHVAIDGIYPNRNTAAKLIELCNRKDQHSTLTWYPDNEDSRDFAPRETGQ